MLTIHEDAKERWSEVKKFARMAGKAKQLADNLRYLAHYAMHGSKKTRCTLFRDFAPLSFEFRLDTLKGESCKTWRYWFNGGLIFHGQHDGFGSGGAPTFSVCLTPQDGWQIHT